MHLSGEYETESVDFFYGYDTEIKPSRDVRTWPRLLWGKAATTVGGWGLSATTELDSKGVVMELQADSADLDVKMRMLASANREDGISVDGVEATKAFDLGSSSRLVVTPRYDIEKSLADVVVGCDIGDKTNMELIASKDVQTLTIQHSLMKDTDVKLAVSGDYQELTVSQQLDEVDRISPTINSNGKISVEWERKVGEDSIFTATLKPNEAIDVEWKDGDWTAMIKLPMDGAEITESAVTVKREVSF